MSDQLQDYMCNLDGDIVLDSLIPANTSGAFCDLFTATHPKAGKLALKRPRGDCYDQGVMKRIEMEASIWKMLRHPRILEFLGITKIGEDVYLVSPFAENGSLPGFLKARPDVDRKRLVIEVVEGLAYLHQCGIIHGDLKGNNILISGEEHILLCDFGLAKHVTSRTSTSLRGAGSIPWQSLELLRDASRRTFQSDVYAFGITISEVLSGNAPYGHHSSIASIITSVLFFGERPLTEPSTAPDGTSYLQLWEEAGKCWDENPALRPSMFGVLRRLDRGRAEMWITTQQINLENSLDPSVDSATMSYFEHASDGPPRTAQLTDNLQTLHWAENIRSRLTSRLFGGLGGTGASQQQPGVSPLAASFAQPAPATSPPPATSPASTTSASGTTPAATSTANPSSPGSATPTANPPGLIDSNMLQSVLGSMGPPPRAGGGTSPFSAASATPPANLPPPEERFQIQLQQMADMGFTDARETIRALLATGGHIQNAIEYILTGGGM